MSDSENKNYPNIGQSLAIAGIMILATILISPLLIITNQFMSKDLSILIYYTIAVGLTFGVAYTIRKRKTGNKTFVFNIENKRIIPFIVISIIALNFGLISPIIDLIPMPEGWEKTFAILMRQGSFFTFLSIVIVAPILEELIFRGIILDGLLKKYSPIKSIIIASVLFGIVHLNPWQFIAAFSLGIFIGWIYYKTKSVSYAIIIHAANNLGGFLIISFFSDLDNLSTTETLAESYGGTLNLIVVLIGSALLFAISIYYLRKEFEKNELQGNKLMKKAYFFITIVLLPGVFLIITSNKQEKTNINLEECFNKNIESTTLMTGWYHISDTDSGFVRQLDKTDELYTINPFPILTAEDITTLTVKINNSGNAYLTMTFGTRGTESWREATGKAVGKKIAFIVNDKLLSAPHVNIEIPNGNAILFRDDYSKEEFEKIEQAIKDNHCSLIKTQKFTKKTL